MFLLSIHTRYETWKPGHHQTKAQLDDREPQVSFEPSQDFSNEDFLNQYNLKVTEMWGESRFLILNNLFAVIHVDSNYSFGRKSQWC